MPNPVDDFGNVKVDFVWGNIPMQPDDARGENTLVPELDNHIIAVTQYNGFPGYTPEVPYLDTIANVVVPDVEGDADSDAIALLESLGLVAVAVFSDNEGGATEENDRTVKSQTPSVGTKVNVGTEVTIDVYVWTDPEA
jgi:hypothetical protein